MKVCFETFGCRLNRAEALEEEAGYVAKGWEVTERHSDADLFVVRGCSVTARAQRDSEKLIAHLKEKYPTVPVRRAGCIENRETNPYAGEDALPMRTARAYLKVQDGCNSRCAFCIVPKFRGKSTSVPFEEVVGKARRFIDAGYHELVVTGCNLTQYSSGGKAFPDLVSALGELDAGVRIRIGSIEPGSCASETVHAMGEHPTVCRFLHLAVQSGSERMLRAMARPYGTRDVNALVRDAVRLMPDLGLGCDLMTGFPDETDIDFEMTMGMLDRLPFTNAHVFPYSERPGTVAASLPSQIDKSVRSSRAHRLAAISDAKRRHFAKRFVGRTVQVVIEDGENLEGWSSEYLWCKCLQIHHFKAKALKRRDIGRFYIQDERHGILYGIVV